MTLRLLSALLRALALLHREGGPRAGLVHLSEEIGRAAGP